MVLISQEDILRALKRFKGIAKQELLAQDFGPESGFRKTHAEARREIYATLIDLVEQSGVEDACVFAFNKYLDLTENNTAPAVQGYSQALEMFFNIIGVKSEQLKQFKIENINPNQFLNMISPTNNYFCPQP
jgi:hypothetical protein